MENKDFNYSAYKLIFPNSDLLIQLTVKSIEEIKDGCIFVLDTNVLLTPYSTGKDSISEIKKVYKSLIENERLFIPGQVIREFAMNRPEKIKDIYSIFHRKLNAGESYLIDNYPFLENNAIFQQLKEKQNAIKKEVNDHKQLLKKLLDEITNWNWDDPVSQLYKELFSSKVIFDPDFTESEIKAKIEFRQKYKVPPGYKDSTKEINSEGDLIIWLSILKLAESKKKHVIFVSHDAKNDWFHKSENQSLFPRYELQYEFQISTPDKTFHIMQLSEFLKLFNVNQDVINEIAETEFVNQLSEDEKKIWYAIKNQRLLSFNYSKMLRFVEPYCIGITTAGNRGLRAYQIDGYSLSGQLGWKLFDLNQAQDFKILDETFDAPRPGYKKGDRGMSQIFCEL